VTCCCRCCCHCCCCCWCRCVICRRSANVQLPAVICRGVTVVVCPLLSLMQDQVRCCCCTLQL
jgi:hypothetical protein